ncbi:CPBP family intramembrane glutamic endopeptidase [Methanobrevibacter sp. TMH8]|uniref:CPBP family intramembrane glutamic endopeptidase n=1 Tax=Methanobrevibacter sp. TMH8 TaxID=2848611 RepID=UPI001CCD9453|nr:CPBP family intramembrane glutamic endopeptidase [Methanobrevibacter sp. TMH8]
MKNIGNLGHIIGFGIFILLAVKFIHKRDIFSVINISNLSSKTESWIKKIRWNNFLKGILIWGVIAFIQMIPYIIYPNYFILNPSTNILFIIICALLFIPAQSISEEIAFRGYLNQGLFLKFKNPLIIILISSLIFGLLHEIPSNIDSLFYFLSTFTFGIILSLVVLTENGLETAMGMHVINNIFAISLISELGATAPISLFIQTQEIPSSIFGSLDQSMELILYLIFLIILIIYKRKEIKALFITK